MATKTATKTAAIQTLVTHHMDSGFRLEELTEAIAKAWMAERRARRTAAADPAGLKAKRAAAAAKGAKTRAENKAKFDAWNAKYEAELKVQFAARETMRKHIGPALWKEVEDHYNHGAFGGHPCAWAWSINQVVDPGVVKAAALVAGLKSSGKVTVAQVG